MVQIHPTACNGQEMPLKQLELDEIGVLRDFESIRRPVQACRSQELSLGEHRFTSILERFYFLNTNSMHL